MKGNLELLMGISGSGKSTYAHEEWLKDPFNTVIVNRDKIRELLFGYTEFNIIEYYQKEDWHKFEKIITAKQNDIIYDALEQGKRVIVDNIHLRRKYLEEYKYWNVPTKIKTFPIDVDTAIARDKLRTKQAREELIRNQHERFGNVLRNIEQNPIDFTPIKINNDPNKTWIYLFDIDSTIAEKGNRNPFDWENVDKDKPIPEVLELLHTLNNVQLSKKSDILTVVVSGRDEVAFEKTVKWFNQYDIAFDIMFMRDKGDTRKDWIVKEEFWKNLMTGFYIAGIFDDRLQVVRRARALGLKVFNVEHNNF